jgi:broad specificity phosphatase PhoE
VTTFVLVRHGETEWHAENRYAGRSDVALTDRGREQAQTLAGWARDADLDAVVCSTLARARSTAEPAAAAAGLALRADARLREVDFGDGEGRSHDEMAQLFPDAFAAFRARPASSPLPGGEDGATALARGLEAVDALHAEFPEGRVLVVAHSTLLRLLLCGLLGLPLDRYRTAFPRLQNVALTEVRLPDGPPEPGTGPGDRRAGLLGLNRSTDRARTHQEGSGDRAPRARRG